MSVPFLGNHRAHVGSSRAGRLAAAGLAATVFLALTDAALVILPLRRIPVRISVNYNEGWNAYHSEALAAGHSIYSAHGLTPLNYPPLSFVVIGLLGRMWGHYVVIGRILAFVSLCVIVLVAMAIVSHLTQSTVAAAFSGAMCLTLFLVLGSAYVAGDDPQLLALAIMVPALLVYTRGSTRPPSVIIVAVLMATSLFVKHNLEALPLAVGIDLLIRTRKLFILWAAALLMCLAAGTVITQLWSGGAFLSNVLAGRGYDRKAAEDAGLHALRAIPVVPAFLGLWFCRTRRVQGLRIAVLYVVAASLIGVIESGGYGVGSNAFFDTYVAASILCGVALGAAERTCAESAGNSWVWPVAWIVLVVLIVFLQTPFHRASTVKAWWKENASLATSARTMRQDVMRVAASPGVALCDNLLVCYWARKPFELDLFSSQEMVITGAMSDRRLLAPFAHHQFSIIQLDVPVPRSYLLGRKLLRVDRPRLAPDGTFLGTTENLMRAIGLFYRPDGRTADSYFYVPR